MSDRGEYRPIPTVLIDGPDFQELTPNARLMLFVLKCKLGPSGIGVIPGMIAALSEHTGLDANQVNLALEVLDAGGWVRTERNVVWVIDGLKFEPSLQRSNANHRKSMETYLNGIPKLPIVEAFRRRYAAWLRGEPDGIPDPMPIPSPFPSRSLNTEDRILKTENKKRSASRSADADSGNAVDSNTAPSNWPQLLVGEWNDASGGDISHGEIGRQIKPLISKMPWPQIHAGWRRFLASDSARFGPAYFRKHFGDFDKPAVTLGSLDEGAVLRALGMTA